MGWSCAVCDTKFDYSEEHDAYYCPQCNEWATKPCDDESCPSCSHRPEKPL